MKKKFIETGTIRKAWIACSIMCACMFGLSSCWDDYDNSELRGDIENLKNRVKTLEEWQKSVNTDIQSLYIIDLLFLAGQRYKPTACRFDRNRNVLFYEYCAKANEHERYANQNHTGIGFRWL